MHSNDLLMAPDVYASRDTPIESLPHRPSRRTTQEFNRLRHYHAQLAAAPGDTVAMDELAPELRELYTNPEQTITTARHVLQSYREGSEKQDRSAASRVFNWTMGNHGIGRDTQRQKRKRIAIYDDENISGNKRNIRADQRDQRERDRNRRRFLAEGEHRLDEQERERQREEHRQETSAERYRQYMASTDGTPGQDAKFGEMFGSGYGLEGGAHADWTFAFDPASEPALFRTAPSAMDVAQRRQAKDRRTSADYTCSRRSRVRPQLPRAAPGPAS